ncbi:MAG: hypothetical protein J5I94_25310 [Phaeodactylibacter sp.]|nr:hypothetical protein [Phaeodactylibacter sp.]
MPDNKVLIVSGEDPDPKAEALLIVDKSGFIPGTPLTPADVEQIIKLGDFVHGQGILQSNPYNIAKPDGSGFYVCNLTGFPFLEGAATIFNLDNSGNLTP